jgi:cobalt/nickel transport system permease protein
MLFERLDPRARLIATAAAIAIVVSTPAFAQGWPIAGYALLSVLLILSSRAEARYLIWRMLAASPFVLLAAGMLLLQPHTPPHAAALVLGKGLIAALLLAFLTATTPLADLLWALGKLKAPPALNLILGMMYRYTSLLSEEYARMERARDCRTVRPLGWQNVAVFGHQLGTLVLRSWDRADRVYAAMLARGFNGEWPSPPHRAFSAIDAAALLLIAGLFLLVRMWTR